MSNHKLLEDSCLKMLKNALFGLFGTIVVCLLYCFSFSLKKPVDSHYFAVYPSDINDFGDFYQRIELDKAWEISKGSSDVSLGVIDSGIDGLSSPDLSPNLNVTLSRDLFYPQGNPFVDNAHHGTYVANKIGAIGENNYGKTGVVWNLDMISLKIANNTDYQEDLDAFLDAVEYATYYNIPIINFSGGFYYNLLSFSNLLLDGAAIPINNYSGLIVCAAGNENYDLDVHYLFPAILPFDNIIVVGASKMNVDEMYCGHTNYGESTVDLFAPAEWTSYAAPLVSGTAAMLLSINPTLTASQLKSLIMDNVDYSTDLDGLCVSNGRLNVYRAAKAAIPAIGLGVNYSLKPLKIGEDHWYCFECDNGIYTFETTGNCNTIGELYADIQSNPLCISSSGGSGDNFSMTYQLLAGTYYLKISTINSATPNNYIINVSNHGHSYTYSYSSTGSTYHKSYCQCGSYVLKPHVFPSTNFGFGPCSFCGEPYRFSFLENAIPICSESYIDYYGNLYLSINDYDDLIY